MEYKGKKILLEDFSNIREETEIITLMQNAVGMVHSQPEKSVLVLADMTNAHYSSRISEMAKEASRSNTPFIKASTMVGVSGIMNIIIRAINTFTGRKIITFKTREEAMEWLAAR